MNTLNSQKKLFLVIGLGKSGIGIAKLLSAEGKQVIILEQSEKKKFPKISKEFEEKGIIVEYKKNFELKNFTKWLSLISCVVISPGVPWNHHTLLQLRALGIKIESEISIAWKRLKHIPWIGITGTNGKTTVTYMLKHILDNNNISSLIGGNIGIPASEIALHCLKNPLARPKFLIMELSSYQIETALDIAPYIGIWTTFTPDHLERHETLEKYFNIKKHLLDKSFISIYNQDDKYLSNKKTILKDGIWTSIKGSEGGKNEAHFSIDSNRKVCEQGKEIFDSSVLTIDGKHNLQNLLLVTAAARKIGVSSKGLENGFKSFKGVAHRLEKVNIYKGITIFNDSKATNFDASAIGLQSIKENSVIIVGGQIKKGNPKDWLEQIHLKASAVILFGESKEALNTLILNSGFNGNIYILNELNEATKTSLDIALSISATNIILSPACASFDQYKNFEERGDHFKEILKCLL